MLASSSPHLYPPFHLAVHNVFQKAVHSRCVSYPISLPSVCYRNTQDVPLLLDPKQQLIFLMIVQTDVFQPSPAQHVKTCQVFLIYFPKCANSGTIQSYAPNVESHQFILKFPYNLSVKKVFSPCMPLFSQQT